MRSQQVGKKINGMQKTRLKRHRRRRDKEKEEMGEKRCRQVRRGERGKERGL